MKKITLHGITVHVGTDREIEHYKIAEREISFFHSLPYVAFSRRMTNKDMVIMAGHDWAKVDPAIPAAWAAGQLFPERYMWTYEGDGVGGEPLDLRECRRKVEETIIRSLVEGEEE